MNTQQTALDAYLYRTAAIHAKLARLQQLADNHFGHDADAISWGHVGDLGRVDAARANALKVLLMRGWIVESGDGHLLTDAGYATIGLQRPTPPPRIDDSSANDSVQPCRPGTKLAKVVAALQNPDGATIFLLMCCTGSCIHAEMSRWSCSTRQTSMHSGRST